MPAAKATKQTEQAPFKPGTDEHKRRFCRMLLDTFDAYKPTVIAWPALAPDALVRLMGLPFWDVAVQTEGFASCRVQALADRLEDPLLKEAVQLNAFEEGRHKLVIEHMLRFYGIKLAPEPDYAPPRDAEWAFIRTGYGECFDSFFAFGLFELARRSGYFPPALVEVFEPVIHEEGRHILFFVNWLAWARAQKSLPGKLWFVVRCAAALAISAFNRLSLAGAADGGKSGDNFVSAGGDALAVSLTPRLFLETCLAENDRRMAQYDPNLLRPRIMPFLARQALRFMKK
ncbi:MAG: ferritin-like domain-containing protein [Alphaproteobacteria bacterium]|nr:ferritin-like domain-containing protein [Alphaproteobacteria bacterium]